MKATLIYNPSSGCRWRRPKPIERVTGWLMEEGFEPRIRPTLRPGDATRLSREAAQEGSRLVIAYGGDGTINEVVEGLKGTDVRLGILPGGTANVLARELSIPRDLHSAVKVLSSGVPTRISV